MSGEFRTDAAHNSERDPKENEVAGESEMQLAARVHESLLPQPVRDPRIEIATRYVPLDGVGGDYCQVVFPEESLCYITICDVTGHGIGPALLATRVSSEVRRLTLRAPPPQELVRQLNTFLLRHFREVVLPVTFFASRIDLAEGTITYSGAGHPGQLVIPAGSGPVELLSSQNLLLGVSENCLAEEAEDSRGLEPGEKLVFFTDGLTETRTETGLLGDEGLCEIAADLCPGSASEAVDCILERIGRRRRGPVRDDMTLIVAEMK